MQLGGHRPAREVPLAGGRGRETRQRQEGMGGGEPARRRVDHEGDPAGRLLEAILEAQAQVLERVQRALGVLGVSALVPGDERQRLGLDPCHRSSLVPGRVVSLRNRVLRLDDLLEGRAVLPVNRGL